MRTDCRTPLVPCIACDLVPPAPTQDAGGSWTIACAVCGRSATGQTETEARDAWLKLNAKEARPLTPALELLDAIEEAMCDLEAIRTVPGAMTAWHRWMDAYRELRMILLEAGA